MTDKEFKRLSRAQLIDIIYQLQLQIDKLDEEKQELENELKDKRIRLSTAGNIADAALEINNCFRSAQDAAEQYLNEIKASEIAIMDLQSTGSTISKTKLTSVHMIPIMKDLLKSLKKRGS